MMRIEGYGDKCTLKTQAVCFGVIWISAPPPLLPMMVDDLLPIFERPTCCKNASREIGFVRLLLCHVC